MSLSPGRGIHPALRRQSSLDLSLQRHYLSYPRSSTFSTGGFSSRRLTFSVDPLANEPLAPAPVAAAAPANAAGQPAPAVLAPIVAPVGAPVGAVAPVNPLAGVNAAPPATQATVRQLQAMNLVDNIMPQISTLLANHPVNTPNANFSPSAGAASTHVPTVRQVQMRATIPTIVLWEFKHRTWRNVNVFLNDIKNLAALTGQDLAPLLLRHLQERLRSTAELMVSELIAAGKQLTWEEAVRIFYHVAGLDLQQTREQAMHALVSRKVKQSSDQSVVEYACSLRQYLSQASITDQSMQCEFFLAGLLPHLQPDCMFTSEGKHWTDLHDCILHAISVETTKQRKSKPVVAAMRSPYPPRMPPQRPTVRFSDRDTPPATGRRDSGARGSSFTRARSPDPRFSSVASARAHGYRGGFKPRFQFGGKRRREDDFDRDRRDFDRDRAHVRRR